MKVSVLCEALLWVETNWAIIWLHNFYFLQQDLSPLEEIRVCMLIGCCPFFNLKKIPTLVSKSLLLLCYKSSFWSERMSSSSLLQQLFWSIIRHTHFLCSVLLSLMSHSSKESISNCQVNFISLLVYCFNHKSCICYFRKHCQPPHKLSDF